MELVEFPEQTVVIAKGQPQYRPLPAHRFADEAGTIACCWKLSLWERLRVLFTGVIWHRIATFNQPLQPQHLSVAKPAFGPRIRYAASRWRASLVCRECGCTDARPCMTGEGPCHWVESDLCSACA